MTGIDQPTGPAQWRGQLTPRRIAVVAVAAIAVALLGWLIARGGGTSSSATPATLVTFAKALKRPIYWAGPIPGDTYEFTETSTGNIFVRYLPKGVRVGDPRAAFRVIATYPYPGAVAGLAAVAGKTGRRLPGGGLMVPSARYPKSVHMAYPGSAYEIEVFDPVPGQASAIALSGQVRPIR
jgi:hypothetical protein